MRGRETSANEPLQTHRKIERTASKPGRCSAPRRAGRQPTSWSCGVRCIGGVTLLWACVRNLRTCRGDAKGKGPSGGPARPKVPRRPFRGGPPRSSEEPRQCLGSEGGGSPASGSVWSTGDRRNRRVSTDRLGGTSRMSWETHVRFCERLGVKFPGPTRQ